MKYSGKNKIGDIQKHCISGKLFNFALGACMANYSVKIVENADEFERVLRLRYLGYGKYYKFSSSKDVIDALDYSQNCVLLLVENKKTKKAIGTIRILDRKFGRIELDSFIDVNSVLPKNHSTCAEATRFTIISNKNIEKILIRVLLFRSCYDYCLNNNIDHFILSTTKTHENLYLKMHFVNAGKYGEYKHSKLGNKTHHTYFLDTRNAAQKFCDNCSLYCKMLCQPLPNQIPYHNLKNSVKINRRKIIKNIL